MSLDANSDAPTSANKAAKPEQTEPATPVLCLQFGMQFDELYSEMGLRRLDEVFCGWLEQTDSALAASLSAYRKDAQAGQRSLDDAALSNWLIRLAQTLDPFLAQLFAIHSEHQLLVDQHRKLDLLFEVKRKFVQRIALRSIDAQAAQSLDGASLTTQLHAAIGALEPALLAGETSFEWRFVRALRHWQSLLSQLSEDDVQRSVLEQHIDLARRYAAWAVLTKSGQLQSQGQVLFKQAQGVDPEQLMRHTLVSAGIGGRPVVRIQPEFERSRDGFGLTDDVAPLAYAVDQSRYCLLCHKDGKDSCRHGLKDGARFRTSAQEVTLAGCPLEQRISEFQQLKAAAYPLAALAMIVLDNPMLAATGHRICNDCVKACIFQKQDGVDIPQTETRTLTDVLDLPWGVEIYSLLTRWNPLNLRTPVPQAASGKTVLVVGQGPAGFTLAHHLLNAGHAVVAIDALRISQWRLAFEPVHSMKALREPLDTRDLAGFGGVAEYGITVRWDKNFLTLVRLLLERRSQYSLHGGIRLGSNLSTMQAFDAGIDHVALAVGAGKPTVLDLPNSLAKGVRTASDFLMALQLTGSARRESLSNLQLQLPLLVVGGGLTAVDAATEAMAYYPVQVENFLQRMEQLGLSDIPDWSDAERAIAHTFISHARAIRDERASASRQNRLPRINALVKQWGGCHIVYRQAIQKSPAYRLNHEELEKALQEGVGLLQELTPQAMEINSNGDVVALICASPDQQQIRLDAGSILIAAGSLPNTVLASDEPSLYHRDGLYLKAVGADGQTIELEKQTAKPANPGFITVRIRDGQHAGKSISMFGDLHPSYAGNVVKAMASAKTGAPVIDLELRRLGAPAGLPEEATRRVSAGLRELLTAKVVSIHRLGNSIVEVMLHAPLAARNFRPGQFFRLQDFSRDMEGIALTGAWVDEQRGLVSLIVLEMGGSTNLCARLTPGQNVVLMGPTGTPTEIPRNQTVLLVGGGLGNAVLFSIGKALRANGCKVVYFAGYKKLADRFKSEQIESASDQVVWCCDEAPGFECSPTRPQDMSMVANVVEALRNYSSLAKPGSEHIRLSQVQLVLAIGSDSMMAAVAHAIGPQGDLARLLAPGHKALASINSPMQCMMKEVCGQCIQRQVDPATGKSSIVFSCMTQDQPMQRVDWNCLHQRLQQNSTLEKLTHVSVSQLSVSQRSGRH